MFLRANKVPNEINKWIVKRLIKNRHIGNKVKETELMINNMISSQTVQNLKALTLKAIMRILNQVTSNKP